VRADRRRVALQGDDLHHLPDRGARHPVAGIFAFTLSWNEFIYALVFLSSPEQKTVPVGVTSELIRATCSSGAADGGRAARLDPGRDGLFVLRRALRRRPDRLGQRLASEGHAQVVIRNLNKTFDGNVHAVKDVNLEITTRSSSSWSDRRAAARPRPCAWSPGSSRSRRATS